MENKTDYVTISLSLHLVFARLMKEHAFFLENSFMAKDKMFSDEAAYHKKKFEKLLSDTIALSNSMLPQYLLESGCILTKYTMQAEKRTESLTGIPINSAITFAERELIPCSQPNITPGIIYQVKRCNQYAIRVLNGMVQFKERILKQVLSCQMAIRIYPTWLTHTIYEAKLYRSYIMNAETKYYFKYGTAIQTQISWNQIMTEHALLTASMMDPTEQSFIQKNIALSDMFAQDTQRLKKSKSQMSKPPQEIVSQTIQFKEINESALQGILNCKIKSMILPLMADHMLRETLFYLYLQQNQVEYTQ